MLKKTLKRISDGVRRLRPAQIIVLMFLAIVLVGALLLTLPFASRSGQSVGFLSALFTSTSATCVTGLVVGDTWITWSGFGQTVILILIQIGGLGFMTVFSVFMLILRKRFGMRDRILISQAVSIDSLDGTVRLVRHIIFGTLLFEGAGVLILTIRFCFDFSFLQSFRLALFHSVSAFCNAGFDILGFLQPNIGLAAYGNDLTVNVTIMLLITIGGLGFLVWEDILCYRRTKRLSVYTKLVLLMSAILIFGGAASFVALEWNNPETIGNLSVGQKILHSFFQSITLRTAGFATVDQGQLTQASKGLSSILMLIGGSSGSTAGGMKTVTFLVVLLTAAYAAAGRQKVSVFHRSISNRQIRNAFSIAAMMTMLVLLSGLFISVNSGHSFTDTIYEAASAMGTVGLTTGITPTLPAASKIVLIILMFFGRVGIMTISFGFVIDRKSKELYRYAQTNLLIG